jgi:hypothetical protein
MCFIPSSSHVPVADESALPPPSALLAHQRNMKLGDDASSASASVPADDPSRLPPVAVHTRSVVCAVRCELRFVDCEGRSDGKGVKQMFKVRRGDFFLLLFFLSFSSIPVFNLMVTFSLYLYCPPFFTSHVVSHCTYPHCGSTPPPQGMKPKTLILVRGSDDDKEHLKQYCTEQIAHCKSVFAPRKGHTLDVAADLSVFTIKLKESLEQTLRWQDMPGDYQVPPSFASSIPFAEIIRPSDMPVFFQASFRTSFHVSHFLAFALSHYLACALSSFSCVRTVHCVATRSPGSTARFASRAVCRRWRPPPLRHRRR